jgi:predicted dienelactone hydrolase
VDASRVVLVGHSLGGYTVLGLAGGWPSWHSGNVAAVIALAPFAEPLTAPGGALGGIAAPVLLQLGTADRFITPVVESRVVPALRAATPACVATFQSAGHLAWTELDSTHHAATAAVATAFLDEILAGRRPAAGSLGAPSTVATKCR